MKLQFQTYNFPTCIRFGAGVRRLLPEELKALKAQRVLIVTDKDVVQLPWFSDIKLVLKDFEPTVFSEVWGNPVVSQVEGGLSLWKESKADAIVAVGGGAPMDVAKAIALMANHPGHLFDDEDGASTPPLTSPFRPLWRFLPPLAPAAKWAAAPSFPTT